MFVPRWGVFRYQFKGNLIIRTSMCGVVTERNLEKIVRRCKKMENMFLFPGLREVGINSFALCKARNVSVPEGTAWLRKCILQLQYFVVH